MAAALSRDEILIENELSQDFDFGEVDRRLGTPEPLPDHVDHGAYINAIRELGRRLDIVLQDLQREPTQAKVAGLRVALGTTSTRQADLAREIGTSRAAISVYARAFIEQLGLEPAVGMRSASTVKKNVAARFAVLRGERKQEVLHRPLDPLGKESAEVRRWLEGLPDDERREAEDALGVA